MPTAELVHGIWYIVIVIVRFSADLFYEGKMSFGDYGEWYSIEKLTIIININRVRNDK